MSTHKALFVDKQQGLVVRDTPTPKPGPGELLAEVKAIGLNPADWKIHQYGLISEDAPILGFDAAGVVKEIGEGVTDFAVGDRMCASSPHI